MGDDCCENTVRENIQYADERKKTINSFLFAFFEFSKNFLIDFN